jgi:hypothetical protein
MAGPAAPGGVKSWFELRGQELCKKLYSYLQALENRQVYRERDNVFNLGLYEDREVMGVAPGLYARPMTTTSNARVSLNVIGAIADTAQNLISQTKPLPMALTEGGNWAQQRRAKQLNKAIEGIFYDLKLFKLKQRAFADDTIFGTGVIHPYKDGNKLAAERVFPNEIIVDDHLCEFSPPDEMHRRKYMNKERAKRRFPKFAAQIQQASPIKIAGTATTGYTADLIPIYESWRLPSAKGKKDGFHCIIIETAVIFTEAWTKDYFPFVFYRWRHQPVGFFGLGIPAIGGRIQVDLNRTMKNWSRSVQLCAVPRLLLPTASNINTEHINNEIGSAIWHTPGNPPSWLQGQLLPTELVQLIQFDIQQLYQLTGVSEMAAAMNKPAGLNSGEAQRVYADTQQNRFAIPSQDYENGSLELADQLIDLAQEIAEEYGDYEIVSQNSKGFDRISWKEVYPGEDNFTLKLWPTNYLKDSPSDQIDQINDMIKMGLLSTKQAKQLLPFPDLTAVLELENAPEEIAGKVIEEIVEHGKFIPPNPVAELPDMVHKVQLAAMHYETIGAPSDVVSMLQDWCAAAVALYPEIPGTAPGAGPIGPGAQGPAGLPPPQPAMQAPPMMSAA